MALLRNPRGKISEVSGKTYAKFLKNHPEVKNPETGVVSPGYRSPTDKEVEEWNELQAKNVVKLAESAKRMTLNDKNIVIVQQGGGEGKSDSTAEAEIEDLKAVNAELAKSADAEIAELRAANAELAKAAEVEKTAKVAEEGKTAKNAKPSKESK